MQVGKEVLKGHIDTIILSIINIQDCYGYEIAKSVREHSNSAFELKEGTLYIALKRLESNGYIRSYWDDGESKGGRRKYYTITENGQAFFQVKKDEWAFMKKMMDDFVGGMKR